MNFSTISNKLQKSFGNSAGHTNIQKFPLTLFLGEQGWQQLVTKPQVWSYNVMPSYQFMILSITRYVSKYAWSGE